MLDKHFIDWESTVFGYGYGTGEPYTVGILKEFLGSFPGAYRFEMLEVRFGPAVTWLMINILCHADIIEYGTSPRYGWLTAKGCLLKAFCDSRTVQDLVALTDRDENYICCLPGHCNCETPCHNPLF